MVTLFYKYNTSLTTMPIKTFLLQNNFTIITEYLKLLKDVIIIKCQ